MGFLCILFLILLWSNATRILIKLLNSDFTNLTTNAVISVVSIGGLIWKCT